MSFKKKIEPAGQGVKNHVAEAIAKAQTAEKALKRTAKAPAARGKMGRKGAAEPHKNMAFYLPLAWLPLIDEVGAEDFGGSSSAYVRTLIAKDLKARKKI